MRQTFYFLRINGVLGRSFNTKRPAVAAARRHARAHAHDRVTLWFRDVIGQHIPVLWR